MGAEAQGDRGIVARLEGVVAGVVGRVVLGVDGQGDPQRLGRLGGSPDGWRPSQKTAKARS